MRRRIGWVWGLLFFNVMTYTAGHDESDSPSASGRQGPSRIGAGSCPPPDSDGEQEAPGEAQHLSHSGYGDVPVRGHYELSRLLRSRFDYPLVPIRTVRRRALADNTLVGAPRLHDPPISTSCAHGRHRDRPCRGGILADQGIRGRRRWTLGRDHLADSADAGGALLRGARRDDGRVVARGGVEVEDGRGSSSPGLSAF